MKKMRIFLGVALVGVAIAAAAATSAKKVTVTYYYYDTSSPAQCIAEEFTSTNCVTDQQTACTDASNRQLYLSRTNSTTCATALTKQ